MGTKFLMVTDEYLTRLEESARTLADLVAELRTTAVEIPVLTGRADAEVRRPEIDPKPPAHEPRPTPDRTYKIGRNTPWSYADVVAREYTEPEFNADMAWKAIKPVVDTTAKRPKDSLRFSLDRDDRFVRIEGREVVWWRRVDPSQHSLIDGEPDHNGKTPTPD